MVHSVSGRTRGVQVKLRSLENAIPERLRVVSRQGAIQIQVYLTLPSLPQTKAYQRLGPGSGTTISLRHFAHPSANFSRGEKSDTLRRFSIPVTLGTPSFRNEKYI